MTKTTETKKRSADEIIDMMLEDYGTSREAVRQNAEQIRAFA
jgi:hypothetical protein